MPEVQLGLLAGYQDMGVLLILFLGGLLYLFQLLEVVLQLVFEKNLPTSQ